MGVPGFFRELVKQYPQIIKNSVGKDVSHLYLDANCLFHPQCFKVLALNADLTDQDKLFEKMAQRIIAFIDYLADFINPSDLFYVAVDGVAPVAKISQQRQRRFGYANDYKSIINKKYRIPHNDSWSNIVITPGTEFMYKLHLKLDAHFKKRIATSAKRGTSYDIIYSSYMTPGEGEHKILQHIKTCDRQSNGSAKVIYGLDADLIFLTMASQYPDLYLLREADQINQAKVDHDDPENVGEELLFVDIDDTKHCINDQFNQRFAAFIHVDDIEAHSGTKSGKTEAGSDMDGNTDTDSDSDGDIFATKEKPVVPTIRYDFCNDYIFICYFLGNDFLPHLPSVDIKVSGMEMVIDSYMFVLQKRGTTMVSMTRYENETKDSVVIDHEFLFDFICSLAAKEENFFKSTLPDHLLRLGRRRCYESERHKRDIWEVENLRAHMDGHGNLSRLIINDPIGLGDGELDDSKYRYYNHYFHTDYRQDEFIDLVCQNYIDGLYWVARYYFEECPTWRWQYRYTHAPFLSDIMNYLSRVDCDDVHFEFQKPLDMYTQLVSVIPQKYNNILPIKLRDISSRADSPVIDMFPLEYPIDMIYKTMLYKCIPHIPYLDIARMESAVSQSPLTAAERTRSSAATVSTYVSGVDKSVRKKVILKSAKTVKTVKTVETVKTNKPNKPLTRQRAGKDNTDATKKITKRPPRTTIRGRANIATADEAKQTSTKARKVGLRRDRPKIDTRRNTSSNSGDKNKNS